MLVWLIDRAGKNRYACARLANDGPFGEEPRWSCGMCKFPLNDEDVSRYRCPGCKGKIETQLTSGDHND